MLGCFQCPVESTLIRVSRVLGTTMVFTACKSQIVMHEVLPVVPGVFSLDHFSENTAPVCRLSAPYRCVTLGTGSRSPLRDPLPLPRTGPQTQWATNAMDHKSNEGTRRSTRLRSACEPLDPVVGKRRGIGATPLSEWTIKIKPGVGRPLCLFFAPNSMGATAPAIFSGEIRRSYSWPAQLVMIGDHRSRRMSE